MKLTRNMIVKIGWTADKSKNRNWWVTAADVRNTLLKEMPFLSKCSVKYTSKGQGRREG